MYEGIEFVNKDKIYPKVFLLFFWRDVNRGEIFELKCIPMIEILFDFIYIYGNTKHFMGHLYSNKVILSFSKDNDNVYPNCSQAS